VQMKFHVFALPLAIDRFADRNVQRVAVPHAGARGEVGMTDDARRLALPGRAAADDHQSAKCHRCSPPAAAAAMAVCRIIGGISIRCFQHPTADHQSEGPGTRNDKQSGRAVDGRPQSGPAAGRGGRNEPGRGKGRQKSRGSG
jgi:hypothetical protein